MNAFRPMRLALPGLLLFFAAGCPGAYVPPTPEQKTVGRLDAVKNLARVYEEGGSLALVRYRQDERNRDVFYEPGLREFFVHPCWWWDECACKRVVMTEAEARAVAEIQSLMMVMEVHPGQSADVWDRFRAKVENRWAGKDDGRLPPETEAVLRLYERISGAAIADRSTVPGSGGPKKGKNETEPPK